MKKINETKLKNNVEKRIKDDIDACNVSGAAIEVKQGGKTVYRACFGDAREDSVYRMASMTKPVTAVAVMQLVERGLITLDDFADEYLPEFSTTEIAVLDKDGKLIGTRPCEKRITLKELLTHTSGLGSGAVWDHYAPLMTNKDSSTLWDALAFYSKTPLLFEPSSAQKYSPLAAFDLLAAIVEKLSGLDYNTYLKKNIFEPCDMKDTTFTPNSDQWARMIPIHNKKDGKSTVAKAYEGCVFGNIPATHYLGGAGLISTLDDYSNFTCMLRGKGEFNGNRIIKEESVRAISTPHVSEKIQSGSQRWGLAVRVITGTQDTCLPIGTYGWSGAYGTHFFIDPENDITAIYLKNSHYDGGSGAVTSKNFETDVYSALEKE